MSTLQNKIESLGFYPSEQDPVAIRRRLIRYINLNLAALGLPTVHREQDEPFAQIAKNLLASHRIKSKMLEDQRCAVDQRIENFLNSHFADLNLDEPLRLPGQTVLLDQHGMAREMSVPLKSDVFKSEILQSTRVANGIVNNPKADKRTTKGTFHVVEGGLPIPGEKLAVPRIAFARMFQAAMNPPEKYMVLPFTADLDEPARTFVSVHLQPVVIPEVKGFISEKRFEVRFFAPGNLVSNLDFVESIFGNAGDPFFDENDLGKDPEHWTGTTGCVILAPQLLSLTKKQLGLPTYDEATDRQRADGMCWKDADELYNNGSAFKLTCRTNEGVVVTLIADNYYGYCKKEVKTQISYSANLYGLAEEEHAGGALVFPSYNLAGDYFAGQQTPDNRTMADVTQLYGDLFEMKPEGYAVDKTYSKLIVIPENAHVSARDQVVTWHLNGEEKSIPLLPSNVYMTPSGYKIRIEKHPNAPTWRLVGTVAEGTFCHKPCTVSGGGKSEISKSLLDFMLYGPIFVADIDEDMKILEEIFEKDYAVRWREGSSEKPDYAQRASRGALSSERSLGSLIKLLTPSSDYTDEYNAWLRSIPNYIYALVYIVKRFHRDDWGKDEWKTFFHVDIVNGFPGHELKYRNRKLQGSYLRVGFHGENAWRTFKLRQDFIPSSKVQTEDDITASVVVPKPQAKHLNPQVLGDASYSVKFAQNCEYRLFQRPDEAIHRGFDQQAEWDLAQHRNFISNFEPLTHEFAKNMVAKAVDLESFTPPMRDLIRKFAEEEEVGIDPTVEEVDLSKAPGYIVSSAHARLVDGKPTKNPRYLQNRPDMVDPFPKYLAEMGMRLARQIPVDDAVPMPVSAFLMGRRNNPPDHAKGIRALAVYNPIHYQPLPELFMDLIASLTGKSPSTTGAGSEGALTKGPFNAISPTADLNAAMVSAILTKVDGFSSAAGFVGPDVRVDHDISLLVPEIWSRMSLKERTSEYMIKEGLLEKLDDYEFNGETILASRLGYRITDRFVTLFMGRVFDNPDKVFDERILKPEIQGEADFADGVKNITEAQHRVASQYFADGSVADAIPPLQALLHIMVHGEYEGMKVEDPKLREMFTLENMLSSDWYQQRLEAKQRVDIAYWTKQAALLEGETKVHAELKLKEVATDAYLKSLVGTLGVDPKLVDSNG